MRAVSGKRMSKLAEQHGWRLARIHGSHHVFVKDGRVERLVIPIHGNETLKIGLQHALMKLMQIREEEL